MIKLTVYYIGHFNIQLKENDFEQRTKRNVENKKKMQRRLNRLPYKVQIGMKRTR
jgi:hypothetical protein